jgi:hypothetical protein
MVITEYRVLVDPEPAVDEPETPVAAEERARDAEGHCWDGRVCDHLDHGSDSLEYGTIHLMR